MSTIRDKKDEIRRLLNEGKTKKEVAKIIGYSYDMLCRYSKKYGFDVAKKLPNAGIDLTGKRFGRLVVIKQDGHITKSIAWLCKCDCGNEKRVRGDYLRNSGAKSCGCFQQENRYKKGRWKIRKAICAICGKDFEYCSSIKPTCCSEECRRQYETDYVRNREHSSLEHKIERLVAGCRHRAKKYGLPCDITTKKVIERMHAQNNKCCKTDIAFEISEANGAGARSPWSPSIDQINPSGGYTMDNIQLVCCMYNLCKGAWRDTDVIRFSKAVRDYE